MREPVIQADGDSHPRADAHFRLLVEGVNTFAMFLINQEGQIASWNKGAELIFGYTPQEAIGMPAANIFTDEDREKGAPEEEIIKTLLLGRSPDHRWHKRKDGSLFWADGVMQRLDDTETGVPQGLGKVLRDATEQKKASLVLEASAARERSIATQLQAALIPPPPESPPGLTLAGHYQPALDEAEVGGDFYDVFAVQDGCTALVVGDLSGKGLAAAQGVATVRNMLRYALYNAQTTAEAINNLDRTLTQYNLLDGFATLFVGVYDHRRQELTYVNCGQEPGLIWRAETGRIEELHHTGAILGGYVMEKYAQKTVTLSTGDVLALFTDGLTEVGPNRQEMLEACGVGRLLQKSICAAPHGSAQSIVSEIIAKVDAFARGGTRDDVALLIGVAV